MSSTICAKEEGYAGSEEVAEPPTGGFDADVSSCAVEGEFNQDL